MKEVIRKVESDLIQNILIEVDEDVPEFLVAYLADWLESYIQSGAKIENEQTLQFGFSLLKFRIANRTLTIDGPDYESIPFKWTNDLTKTLLVFKEHKFTVESYDLESEYSKLQDTVLIGKGFEEEPFMFRKDDASENNPEDSGWFAGSLREDIDNDDPENISMISLYELVLKQPLVLPYLAFPEGCIILFENETVEIINDEYYLEPIEGSYVYEKSVEKE